MKRRPKDEVYNRAIDLSFKIGEVLKKEQDVCMGESILAFSIVIANSIISMEAVTKEREDDLDSLFKTMKSTTEKLLSRIRR